MVLVLMYVLDGVVGRRLVGIEEEGYLRVEVEVGERGSLERRGMISERGIELMMKEGGVE